MRESEVQIGNSGSLRDKRTALQNLGCRMGCQRASDQGPAQKMECIEFTSAQLNLSPNARSADRTISAIHLKPEGNERRSFLKAPREALH